MKRRHFLTSVAVTAAGATAAVVAPGRVRAELLQERTRLRVTVLKVTLDEALDEEYRDGGAGPCPVFQEGQEFIIESPFLCPADFCHWAWADIRSFIQESYFGREDPIITCCTDGIRPVFFKIERTEA
ncbi:MAG: TIGR04076 family protein [Gemmatimonadota bacterium]|nr:MAG: TIGR04076 family protein [Gemmatimonadota bacterium]